VLDDPTDERPAAPRSPPAFAGMLSAKARAAGAGDLLHEIEADLGGLPTGLPASLRGLTPEPAPGALEPPEPSLPDTPRPVRGRPLWLREGGELAHLGSDADAVLEGEPGAELSTMPPLSYDRQGPISIRVSTVPPAPQASATVELDPDPPLDPTLRAVMRALDAQGKALAEQATALSALRSELHAAQGGQLSTLLDSHERVEAAKERARVEAHHEAAERAERNAWLRKMAAAALGIATIAAHVLCAYALGRPDTRELAEVVIRYVLGGEM
jgi:hypothetical protein